MQKFVVDASFVLGFLLPDERKSQVDSVFIDYKEGKISLISSLLLEFEVGNGLKSAYLSKRLSKNEVKKNIRLFSEYGIKEIGIDLEKTVELALKYNLSFYDAGYVYIAKKEKANLLSFDKRLQYLLE
jgi:predicted nucleic acid-binding protein